MMAFYAVCESAPRPGAHWYGPSQANYEDAQADADEHNRKHPGHEAMVAGTANEASEGEE